MTFMRVLTTRRRSSAILTAVKAQKIVFSELYKEDILELFPENMQPLDSPPPTRYRSA